MKKLYELKNQWNTLLDAAEKAVNDGDMDLYNAKKGEADAVKVQIAALEQLENEKKGSGAQSDGANGVKGAAYAQAADVSDKPRNSGKEYVASFLHALRNGYSPKNGRGVERLNPLFDALTITTGTPEGADGGFLVPIEFDNMIHEERRQLIALSEFFTTENVSGYQGWRAIDTTPTAGFALVDEMATIPRDQQPAFRKVPYAVKKYGLIVPVSAELIADETAGILPYLARWLARKGVLTENTNLITLLNTLSGTAAAAGTEIKALKTALNKTLDPAIAAAAVIITNQSGFDILDQLLDDSNRPLLQPDPTSGTPMLFKSRRVVMMSDATLPNDGTTGAPVYVGDFRQFATLFRRQPLEVATTNIGGNAWVTDSVEARGIMRLDQQVMDNKAAVKLTFAVS